MNSPNDIEKSLQRLMPAALSDSAQRNISQMLANLADDETADHVPEIEQARLQSGIFRGRSLIAVAAALILAAIPTWITWRAPLQFDSADTAIKAPVVTNQNSEAVLIDRMLVTDHLGADQIYTKRDGSMIKQINRNVITRERYRTGKNGYLITISESREEKVLIPKNRF